MNRPTTNTIFETGEVHIIAARNLDHAERQILPWLSQSNRESTLLGHAFPPCKPYYVTFGECARPFARKLKQSGIEPTAIKYAAVNELDECTVEEIERRLPDGPDVLITHDAGALVNDEVRNGPKAVALMRQLQRLAERRGLGVTLVMRAEEAGYSPRERIAGTVHWARLASTVTIVDLGSQPGTVKITSIPLNLEPDVREIPSIS